MFCHIKNSIDNTMEYASEFIINENKFTRQSKFSF